MKAHVLTGCDVTRKVGTTFAALNSEPEKYLMSFGEMDEPSNESLQAAEKYLVEVVKKNSKCDNFNDLRYHFHKSLRKSLAELPPSSSCINGHLLRCHYFVRLLANLLIGRGTTIEVISYGWQRIESVLYPDKCQKSITPRVNVALAQEIVFVDRCKYYVLNIVNVVIIVKTIHDHEYKL